MSPRNRGAALGALALAGILISAGVASPPAFSVATLVAPRPAHESSAAQPLTPPPSVRGDRLHIPATEEMARQLEAAGRLPPDADPAQVEAMVRRWARTLDRRGPAALAAEDASLRHREASWRPAAAAVPVTAPILAIPVEFAATERLTFQVHNDDGSRCITVTNTFTGPMHSQIPYPGGGPTSTLDNHTLVYPSTEPLDYARLIFGRTGFTKPLRSGDPNINGGAGSNIRGLTVEQYYAAQSDDTVTITGTVAPWVQVAHSEAYYGLDWCIPNLSPLAIPDEQLGSLAELTVAAAQRLKHTGGRYVDYSFWKRLDADDDGFVDNLWIFHAGRGQDYGGGAQGAAAIWSRASNVGSDPAFPGGYTIHDNGTSDPDDDIRLGSFTMLPEDSDIGVLIEEFGHSFFDLPDLYTRRSSNSVGWWAPMSPGVWGGELAGTRPVNMPLFFRMVADCSGSPCGWANPVKVVTYTTAPETIVLGEAGRPAGGTVAAGPFAGHTIYEGLRVSLPDQHETVPNRAGDDGGAYSTSATGRNLTLARAVDLTTYGGPLTLTLQSVWEIPRYWGYAYLEASTDGETFESLPDLDGLFTEDNPYGLNEGFGLTGSGQGTMRFDVSRFAGSEVTLRFRYYTLQGPPGSGWWIDDLVLDGTDDALTEFFFGGLDKWDVEGWRAVPFTLTHPHYYLVEWRNGRGFDEALTYATATNFKDQDEWRVDRVPANVPGAVVMYRNLKYGLGGEFLAQLRDPPSIGSKYALLVADLRPKPHLRPSGRGFPGRLESIEGSLTLQDQANFRLEVRDPDTGELLGTEEMPGREGQARFDDARGYYPGFRPGEAGEMEAWDQDASVVLPSRDGRYYSTRVTRPDGARP
ncbi:MAG: immune inhibitor A domain-containing protein, partial [Anaerolineae bacterium]